MQQLQKGAPMCSPIDANDGNSPQLLLIIGWSPKELVGHCQTLQVASTIKILLHSLGSLVALGL